MFRCNRLYDFYQGHFLARLSNFLFEVKYLTNTDFVKIKKKIFHIISKPTDEILKSVR